MTNLVVTLLADRGKKYDETGQCISSHNGSIVFLPRSAKPGEHVRVRLIPVGEKVDARGKVMYQAEYAWPAISQQFRKAVAEEARVLRGCNALATSDMQVVLRAQGIAYPQEWASFEWFYFGASGSLYGSRFSPAALLVFEAFPSASEGGLVELLAWLVDASYYTKRESGEIVEWGEFPELLEERIRELEEKRGDVIATLLKAEG
ncbi:MAG: hypothetical protein WAX57_04275 [Minisyncoccia bacterium]